MLGIRQWGLRCLTLLLLFLLTGWNTSTFLIYTLGFSGKVSVYERVLVTKNTVFETHSSNVTTILQRVKRFRPREAKVMGSVIKTPDLPVNTFTMPPFVCFTAGQLAPPVVHAQLSPV